MPTIIDSLVVLLKLDTKSLSEEQKKALEDLKKLTSGANSSGKEFDAWGKKVTESITNVRNGALRLATLLTAGMGIEKFTAYTVANVAATGRLAYNIGQTTQETSLWEEAVKKLGGNGDAAGAAMQGLTNQVQQFALTGQSSIVPIFRQLGISLTDGNNQLKTATQLYLDLADAIQKQHINPRTASFILGQLGLDQGTINLILRGRDAVNQYVEAARQAGVANDASAPSFQKIETAWANLIQELTTGGRTFIEEIASPISWVLRLLTRGAHFLNTHGAQGKLDYEGDEAVPGTQAAVDEEKRSHDALLQRQESGNKTDITGEGFMTRGTDKPTADANLLFRMIQGNERSGDRAVSSKDAIGRNQIILATAKRFDPNATEEKLKDPAYNNYIARRFEDYLNKKYHGNIEDIEVAYNWGEGHADQWIMGGRNINALPQETQRYLMHGREFMRENAGSTVNQSTTIGQVNIHTQATDAKGIARDIKSELAAKSVTVQSNTGPQ